MAIIFTADRVSKSKLNIPAKESQHVDRDLCQTEPRLKPDTTDNSQYGSCVILPTWDMLATLTRVAVQLSPTGSWAQTRHSSGRLIGSSSAARVQLEIVFNTAGRREQPD